MIAVSYARINEKLDIAELTAGLNDVFCLPDNKAYIDKLASRGDRTAAVEGLAALTLLGAMLCARGIDTGSLSLERNENGKPYFSDFNIKFSLAHSGMYVTAALCDTTDVGVDIECSHIEHERAERLAKRFFNREELNKFEKSPESFLRIWTEKEAYVKLRGETLARVISEDCRDGHVREKIYYHHYTVDGYPMTVCTYSNEEAVISEMTL